LILTLGRYFLRRYLVTMFWFFIGVIAIIYLVDFSETTGRLAGFASYSLIGVLYLTALRLPLILQQTIPFITLFVGMTTLITLNRKSELVVARAAGSFRLAVHGTVSGRCACRGIGRDTSHQSARRLGGSGKRWRSNQPGAEKGTSRRAAAQSRGSGRSAAAMTSFWAPRASWKTVPCSWMQC